MSGVEVCGPFRDVSGHLGAKNFLLPKLLPTVKCLRSSGSDEARK